MYHATALFLVLAFALGTAWGEAIETPAATSVSGKIDWVFDYAEGEKLSRSTGKPLFVVFRCER